MVKRLPVVLLVSMALAFSSTMALADQIRLKNGDRISGTILRMEQGKLLVKTDFARALWENPDILKRATAADPLRRIGEPEEIAGIAVYLSARSGSFTTGQNFVIDGGSTTAR